MATFFQLGRFLWISFRHNLLISVPCRLGQSPARQTANGAGLPSHTVCTTVNKVCASSLKALALAAQTITLGTSSVVVAAGAESMSNVPHYMSSMRLGSKYGDQKLVDGILRDGLMDSWMQQHMGDLAELCAAKHNLSREAQDDYALTSYSRAQKATAADYFEEMISIELSDREGPVKVESDEEAMRLDESKLRGMKSAFQSGGTVTAANAAPLSDGAAAIVLMSGAMVGELGIEPLAKVLGWADAEREAENFTIAPSLAIPKALEHAGLKAEDIDYYEINEAFSAVALATMQLLGLATEKVNVFGGSVALGHPLGGSGARIISTLTSVLRNKKAKFGCASICNGGGGASAVIIENLHV